MKTRTLVLGLVALPLVACRPKDGTHEPGRNVSDWTLAEIEAELARNDDVLVSEGIMIAMASPVVTPNGPTPATDTTELGTEPGPEPETQPEANDDGDVTAPAPEPTSVQPTSMGEEALEFESAPARHESRRSRVATRRASDRDMSTRCERVCDLAAATCELETQICELAARHPAEPRYAKACERAEQQCEAASQACQRCED